MLGFDLTRYECNALAGIVLSTTVFWLSALFNRREGDFKERIEALEADLSTPAYANTDDRVRPEGLKAYRLMGWVAVFLGVVLALFTLPVLHQGGWLNALTGTISMTIGAFILWSVRKYERQLPLHDTSPSEQ